MAQPSVEIKEINETIGKGLFASRDFSEGETIFEEQPLVSCQFSWNASYEYKACDFCLRPLETAQQNARRLTAKPDLELMYSDDVQEIFIVTCNNCKVQYCSTKCRDAAWIQHHQELCIGPEENPDHPLVLLQEAWKQMHYPPESATIMLLAKIVATVKLAPSPVEARAHYDSFCDKTINDEEQIVHKLMGNEFQGQLENLRDLFCKVFTPPLLPAYADWLTEDGFRSLLAMVGTNSQGIGTSPLSIWADKCQTIQLDDANRKELDKHIDEIYDIIEENAGQFLNNEGSGLYVLQRNINHSCVPNALTSFEHNDYTLTIKALKSIQQGEQICISYLDECELERSRHSRVKFLRVNYLFTCKCPKCENEKDQADVTSEEEMSE